MNGIRRLLGNAHLPEPDGAVIAGGDEGPTVRSKHQPVDAAGMPTQGRTSLARSDIPELDLALDCASGQRSAIGRERQAEDQSLLIAQRRPVLPARHVPENA